MASIKHVINMNPFIRRRQVRVRIEIIGASTKPYATWHYPETVDALVSQHLGVLLAGRHAEVATVVVSTLTKAEARAAGYAYAEQLEDLNA